MGLAAGELFEMVAAHKARQHMPDMCQRAVLHKGGVPAVATVSRLMANQQAREF